MLDYSGQQFGNYHLQRKIGSGGFASVYLAEDLRLKTLVAIKVLNTRLQDQVFRKLVEETHIMHLKHPNIIEILNFGVRRLGGFDRPFIVMTYAPTKL
jgi:eukaryotic-like serine/threonine-protein kinase